MWSNFVSVQEECIYSFFGFNQIQFCQEVRIIVLVGGWQCIKNKIEDCFVMWFYENVVKGCEGFECVLEMSRIVFVEEKVC